MWDPSDSCGCPPRGMSCNSSCFDKENIQQLSTPAKTEDYSFYGKLSPVPCRLTGASPSRCNHNIVTRRPLEEHDLNSRDSGFNEGRAKFPSPGRGSFEIAESMEEDFFEDFFNIEPLGEDLPQDFSNLISGPISEAPSTSPRDLVIRPVFRRAVSLHNESVVSRSRSRLFEEVNPAKRGEPPEKGESPETKKQKVQDGEHLVPMRPPLARAVSATEESIMCAVQKSEVEPDLIGDFTKTFCLPLTQGRHQDLKSITSATLFKLIRGDFKNNVASFKIIDCRYPYEYEGGHIHGAVNLYTKEQCLELLKNCKNGKEESSRRSNILVFHCEFSSERGPNLYRYLREQDRQLNQDVYPSLHFPEVYLLEGGYKNFFQHFAEMCMPRAYTEMLHPEFESELRYFRIKSKTWTADQKQRKQCRSNFKRLEL